MRVTDRLPGSSRPYRRARRHQSRTRVRRPFEYPWSAARRARRPFGHGNRTPSL